MASEQQIPSAEHCAEGPNYAMLADSTPPKAKKHVTLQLVTNHRNTQSTPRRPKNAEVRSREYLTVDEVNRLREAAKKVGRNGHRDYWLITMAYRHGLRVSELTSLTWDAVSFDEAKIHIKRLKNGTDSRQPIEGDELRALRQFKRGTVSAFVFTSERGGPLSARAVQTIVARAGELAGFDMPVHPHMLRHARGYRLANSDTPTRTIQELLGHKNIQHTVKYTALSGTKFYGLTKD